MKNLVVWLTALGLAAVGLHFVGVDLPIFGWVDGFGETAGRAFRAALAAGGVVLFMFSVGRRPKEHDSPRADAPKPGRTPSNSVNAPKADRVQQRWPKLARRSGAYARSSTAAAAPATRSRPGY